MKACPALRYLPLLPQPKVLTSYDVNIVWPTLSQGPLITDGRNRSKWTGLYVGLSKTLK